MLFLSINRYYFIHRNASEHLNKRTKAKEQKRDAKSSPNSPRKISHAVQPMNVYLQSALIPVYAMCIIIGSYLCRQKHLAFS